ncbi:MAG: hypothetical protein ACRC6A_06615 [Fusobacteriaceae bacterium]
MPLSSFDQRISGFNDYYAEYVTDFSNYKTETYSKEIDANFEQIKTPMGEIVQELFLYLHLSHTCENYLSSIQIQKALEVISKFENLHDKHREMKAISQQLELKNNIQEIQATQNQVVDIKNNLFNIFSFMVGLLGFVFINFNVFKDIGNFPIDKIIIVVLILNFSFMSGITLSLNMFREILYKNDNTKSSYGVKFIVTYLIFTIAIIIFYKLVPYFIKKIEEDSPKNNIYTIEKYELKLDKRFEV